MTIPASELVKITPRVLAGTGTDLVFNGLFLSDSAAAPAAEQSSSSRMPQAWGNGTATARQSTRPRRFTLTATITS